MLFIVQENSPTVVLYAMSQKGFDVLSFLVKNDQYKVCIKALVIGKDAQVENDYSEDIERLALKNNVAYHFRNEQVVIEADYTIAISWRWLIQSNNKLIVLHDSLLPKYRGFAPLVNMLKNGEEKIGVTALFASEEYDKGDIIHQIAINIIYPIKIKEAIDKVGECYVKMIDYLLNKISNNQTLNSIPQVEDDATYSLWLDNQDYRINWNNSAKKIVRFIHATGSPYNGAVALVNGEEKIIDAATELSSVLIENESIGKVIFFQDNCPVIVCKEGLLKIEKMRNLDGSSYQLKKFRTRFS